MNLVPVNPPERRTAEAVQQVATQTINHALNELRRADAIRHVGNQLIDAMIEEMRDHRQGTEAWNLMDAALANLNSAERVIRLRGETNGR